MGLLRAEILVGGTLVALVGSVGRVAAARVLARREGMVAGVVLTIGARSFRRIRRPFQFEEFAKEAGARSLLLFLVGGLVFIFAYLIF